MNVNATSINNAQTPEEAAQLFAAIASKALAEVLSKAISDSLVALSPLAVNPLIQGWQSLVQGCAVDLCWERSLGRPVGQVCVFSPYEAAGVQPLGVGIGVGVSITASF